MRRQLSQYGSEFNSMHDLRRDFPAQEDSPGKGFVFRITVAEALLESPPDAQLYFAYIYLGRTCVQTTPRRTAGNTVTWNQSFEVGSHDPCVIMRAVLVALGPSRQVKWEASAEFTASCSVRQDSWVTLMTGDNVKVGSMRILLSQNNEDGIQAAAPPPQVPTQARIRKRGNTTVGRTQVPAKHKIKARHKRHTAASPQFHDDAQFHEHDGPASDAEQEEEQQRASTPEDENPYYDPISGTLVHPVKTVAKTRGRSGTTRTQAGRSRSATQRTVASPERSRMREDVYHSDNSADSAMFMSVSPTLGNLIDKSFLDADGDISAIPGSAASLRTGGDSSPAANGGRRKPRGRASDYTGKKSYKMEEARVMKFSRDVMHTKNEFDRMIKTYYDSRQQALHAERDHCFDDIPDDDEELAGSAWFGSNKSDNAKKEAEEEQGPPPAPQYAINYIPPDHVQLKDIPQGKLEEVRSAAAGRIWSQQMSMAKMTGYVKGVEQYKAGDGPEPSNDLWSELLPLDKTQQAAKLKKMFQATPAQVKLPWGVTVSTGEAAHTLQKGEVFWKFDSLRTDKQAVNVFLDAFKQRLYWEESEIHRVVHLDECINIITEVTKDCVPPRYLTPNLEDISFPGDSHNSVATWTTQLMAAGAVPNAPWYWMLILFTDDTHVLFSSQQIKKLQFWFCTLAALTAVNRSSLSATRDKKRMALAREQQARLNQRAYTSRYGDEEDSSLHSKDDGGSGEGGETKEGSPAATNAHTLKSRVQSIGRFVPAVPIKRLRKSRAK